MILNTPVALAVPEIANSASANTPEPLSAKGQVQTSVCPLFPKKTFSASLERSEPLPYFSHASSLLKILTGILSVGVLPELY